MKPAAMDRRFFLASLLAVATLDPERLLWIPGKKTIFVPKPTIDEYADFHVVSALLMATYQDREVLIEKYYQRSLYYAAPVPMTIRWTQHGGIGREP